MDYQIEQRICQICVRMPPLLDGVASAFDYIGAAATWIKKMKYGDRPYLAEGAAAYLAAQWVRLGWSYPDLIIPVPLSRIRRFERGYNQSELLASHLSEILNVPMKLILGRKSGDFSQAGLSRKQRMALSEQSFYLKLKDDFQGKKLLLIDDVMTTGSTLRRCAEVLLEKEPGPIQALVLCRAIK